MLTYDVLVFFASFTNYKNSQFRLRTVQYAALTIQYSDYITYSTGTVTHTAYNTIQLLTPLLLNTTITTTMFLISMLF